MNLWGWVIGEQRGARIPVGRLECGPHQGDDPLGDVQEEGGVCRGTPLRRLRLGGVMGWGLGRVRGLRGGGVGPVGGEGGRRQGQDRREWRLAWASCN